MSKTEQGKIRFTVPKRSTRAFGCPEDCALEVTVPTKMQLEVDSRAYAYFTEAGVGVGDSGEQAWLSPPLVPARRRHWKPGMGSEGWPEGAVQGERGRNPGKISVAVEVVKHGKQQRLKLRPIQGNALPRWAPAFFGVLLGAKTSLRVQESFTVQGRSCEALHPLPPDLRHIGLGYRSKSEDESESDATSESFDEWLCNLAGTTAGLDFDRMHGLYGHACQRKGKPLLGFLKLAVASHLAAKASPSDEGSPALRFLELLLDGMASRSLDSAEYRK